MALVRYNGKNVFGVGLIGGELIRLLPGINEIEDEKLKLMKNHLLFQSRINNGAVQIMHETVGKDGKVALEEVLANIPKIFDLKLLKKLIESDGRDQVVRAAQEQREKIKNPAKAKADESAEHFQ